MRNFAKGGPDATIRGTGTTKPAFRQATKGELRGAKRARFDAIAASLIDGDPLLSDYADLTAGRR